MSPSPKPIPPPALPAKHPTVEDQILAKLTSIERIVGLFYTLAVIVLIFVCVPVVLVWIVAVLGFWKG